LKIHAKIVSDQISSRKRATSHGQIRQNAQRKKGRATLRVDTRHVVWQELLGRLTCTTKRKLRARHGGTIK
jgi:hypothetical protein